ncbi:hypothetical protein HGRIS_008150 [Hohenbuehelia grisea]|uniref:4-coumarate--CoA ligase n=1 Tax=Hohenbuehelia grisea TaxID=104357 RepID=A0ABR3J7D1_9AGAR
MEFSVQIPLPAIPDDLTVPQFLLDSQHPSRPRRPEGVPWLVEDASGRPIGLEEIKHRVSGLANAMSIRWSIQENDVVCIFSPNHVDYPVAIWATHKLGAIITPANPSYTIDELAHQLQTTKAALILVHPECIPTALAAARKSNISPTRIAQLSLPQASTNAEIVCVDDLIEFGVSRKPNFIERRLSPGESKTKLAFFNFSSGTTGKPKAVAISHYSVVANVIQMAVHLKLDEKDPKARSMSPGDVAIAVLPMFHIYGLVVNLHYILFSGMSLVVIPKFNFEKFLDSIVRHRMTHLLLVPPQIVLLCKHPAAKGIDFSHVKFCMSGAAPLSGDLVEQVVRLMPNARVGQGYGLTETCTSIAMFPPEQKVGTIGSAGRLIPGITARVVKADGSLASPGELGELVVKGPSMALGYSNNPKATKETFVNGWVHTGDEVMINDKCELYVLDRVKEIFKVKGFQVAPAELEGHLLKLNYVSDACVVSIMDDYSGELPLAYVVLDPAVKHKAKDPQQAARLKASIAKHVEVAKVRYKWLTGGIEFIDAIPKNPSGKILRRVLRDKARAERANAVPQAQAKL